MGEEESEQSRKLFLGGLNYQTDESNLRDHFSSYGELVDVVVMRFPDSKRSRGFGFITFSSAAEADACFADAPHTIEDTEIEAKRATAREESRGGKRSGAGGGAGGKQKKVNTESHKKLFIGGLDYSTDNDSLKEYFSQFGTITDSIVMTFRDTKRSRGFGFVTYSSVEEVDACQAARPHTLNGKTVETKRATPKEDSQPGGSGGQTSTKVFIGGLKDGITDEDLQEYFAEYGTITSVEQLVEKSTGRKRGFGFVEFEDYDSVDRIILKGEHTIKDWRIDVKRAVSKEAMRNDGSGGRGGGSRGGGGGGGGPAPWDNGGGYGGGYGNGGGYSGGNNYGGGGWGGQGGGGGGGGYGNYGNPAWGGGQGGGGGGSWGNQGGGQWGGNQGGGWGNGGASSAGYSTGMGMGGGGGYNKPMGGGGAMRNQIQNRSGGPYSRGGQGGGRGGW